MRPADGRRRRSADADARRLVGCHGRAIRAPRGGRRCRRSRPTIETEIPREVGLGGSSAIVIATLRALCALARSRLDPAATAAIALAVETEDLGIAAGPQDRLIQAHEGLLYLDFSELGRGALRAPRPRARCHRCSSPGAATRASLRRGSTRTCAAATSRATARTRATLERVRGARRARPRVPSRGRSRQPRLADGRERRRARPPGRARPAPPADDRARAASSARPPTTPGRAARSWASSRNARRSPSWARPSRPRAASSPRRPRRCPPPAERRVENP